MRSQYSTPKAGGEKKPAVAYYRCSDPRQDESIGQQREEVRKYAAANGYEIAREYIDDGVSGDDTDRREGFKRMVADAALGDFQYVLCWDQSRFGRFSQMDAGYWTYPLRKAGVKGLVTLDKGEQSWESAVGQLCFGVNQMGDHEHNLKLSRNVARGMLQAVREGRRMAVAPYGLKAKAGKLAFGDPDKAAVVKELFVRYAAGADSLRSLARELTARGVPTATGGGEWAPSSVRRILTNPVYTGDLVWNRATRSKYHAITPDGPQPRPGERRLRGNGEDAWVVTPDAHPALVDRATFEAVQRRLAGQRGQTTPGGRGRFLFTGLIRCGMCGHRMHGRTEGRYKGKPWKVYVCAGGHQYGVCRLRSVRESAVLDCCTQMIAKELLNPDDEEAWAFEVERTLADAARTDPERLKRLKAEAAALESGSPRGRRTSCWPRRR
jgi:DNA invertase Pin-like site-specific DNA recombinase